MTVLHGPSSLPLVVLGALCLASYLVQFSAMQVEELKSCGAWKKQKETMEKKVRRTRPLLRGITVAPPLPAWAV